MSRAIQDQFIDDEEEEEVCPLCVEELDLTDKNFRPCPCGYQICQFCYNNIKTTMNGLCPACRRPYDDKNIQYKVVSPEEMAQHKQNLAQQAKKKAAARQKEAQKREADHLSRKHLAGLRVRQKNLVYVTGLKPKVSGEKLVEGLRGPEFFGQYGDIVKIVVSKSKDAHVQQNQPIGIYITFVHKEDAALCISTIDGLKQPDGGRLRAQYGTTKYCSAYLRGDNCTNRNCMFLHEPGEDSESFTRQDLSNLNAISTQEPASFPVSQSPQPQAPIQHAQPVAAAQQDNEQAMQSPLESPRETHALPATASWADQARRASRTTSTSIGSPLETNSSPVVPEGQPQDPALERYTADFAQAVEQLPAEQKHRKQRFPYLDDLPKKAFNPKASFRFHFPAHYTEKDIWLVENMPPLFDPYEGTRRRLIKERQAEEMRREVETQADFPPEIKAIASEVDDTPDQAPGGSSQLGGEPEERPERTFSAHSLLQQQAIGSSQLGQGQNLGADELSGLGSGRGLGQQHTAQQQLLFQQLNKMGGPQSGSQNSNHGRQPSRYFLNEAMGTASKNFAKHSGTAAGQNPYVNNINHNQAAGSQFSYTSVQGPPPGLKTTGTPPVTGNNIFAQGHGFTPGVGYNRENDKLWDMHQRRGNASGPDAGKRELMFPYHQYPSTSSAGPAQGALSFPYGSQTGTSYQDPGNPQKQKKKGKKHRHANTSSSGGGVVDVADPSILQMRVGGSLSGQAGYGQGQGGFPSSLHGNTYPRW